MGIENWIVSFPCPDCGQKFLVTVSQLEEGGVMICPTCKLTNAEAELAKLEGQLEDLGKSIQRVKKYLQINSCLNQQPQ